MAESIRIQAIDGQWTTLGLAKSPGIVPENIQISANEWGADQLTCTLQRDPTELAVDLTAWTPCELEVDGTVVWEGRVREASRQGGATPSVSLVGEGWQYHLDDDQREAFYLATTQSEWQDMRPNLNADLTKLIQAGTVSSDEQGGILLGFPKGLVLAANQAVGVWLDLGPIGRAKAAKINFSASGAMGTSADLYLRGSNYEDILNSPDFANYQTARIDLATNPFGGTSASGYRYIGLFVYVTAPITLAADFYLRVSSVAVASDSAYISAFPVSSLVAKTVILDALNTSTVLLSADRSQIATTSFVIPSLDWRNSPRTPRDVLGDINNLHNYRLQIGLNRIPAFQPLATSPVAVINTSDPGVDWSDSSSGSGDNIVNRVIVTGNDGAGNPVRTEKYASSLPGVPLLTAPGVGVTNPSATVDTSSWTTVLGTLTRTTTAGEFNSTPGAFKIVPAAQTSSFFGSMKTTLTGTFKAGTNYVFSWSRKNAVVVNGVMSAIIDKGGALSTAISGVSTGGGFTTHYMGWTPSVDVTTPDLYLQLYHQSATAIPIFFDDVAIRTAQSTLADRRGFNRTQTLQIGSAIDPGTAEQLATLYLQAHSTTPFKGACTISSPDAARDPKSGRPISPQEFIQLTMRPLRFGDLVNPDDGGYGRDGIIRDANYSNGTVSLTIDNSNRNLEALLQRMAVVQGG